MEYMSVSFYIILRFYIIFKIWPWAIPTSPTVPKAIPTTSVSHLGTPLLPFFKNKWRRTIWAFAWCARWWLLVNAAMMCRRNHRCQDELSPGGLEAFLQLGCGIQSLHIIAGGQLACWPTKQLTPPRTCGATWQFPAPLIWHHVSTFLHIYHSKLSLILPAQTLLSSELPPFSPHSLSYCYCQHMSMIL